jgi:hypothetical protein
VVGEDRSQWDGTLKGMATATARAAVWTSTDGRTWERVPHTAALDVGAFLDTMEDPSTGGMSDVVAGPAGLVAVGSVCTAEPPGCEPMAWTSADGVWWERSVAMHEAGDQAEFTQGLAAVAASGTEYVALNDRFALASADGRTWRRVLETGGLLDIATVGGRFFTTSQCSGGTYVSVSDDRNIWAEDVQVGERLPGSICEPLQWHLAASADRAVAVGSTTDTDEPRAMVSVGE